MSTVARISAPSKSRPHGPAAIGVDLRRFWALTFTLASTEFKLRFFGSALGYLWTLMRPLLLFGVLYLVFAKVAHVNKSVAHYPVYLLTAIILFTYFAEAAGGNVASLVMRENLLRKMRFPRLVIPLSVSLTAVFNLATNLVVVLIFALASGVSPRWSWFELPVLIVLLVIFSTGVGMLLSAAYVRYRDIAPIWEVLQQLLFYGSGIFFIVATLGGRLWFLGPTREVLLYNPLAAVFSEMHHAFLDPHAPTVAATLGVRILIPLGIVFAAFGVGLWFFNRQAPRIAENL